MTIRNALASVAVSSIDAAAAWYERLLGRPADQRPMPTLAEWTFPGGGALQVYEGRDRAGGGSVTLTVDDLDAVVSTVASLGLPTGKRSDTPQVKTLMLSDPDGNTIAFAQALKPGLAR